MKLARVQQLTLTVHGNVSTVVLTPGAVVDLDQVVGHQGGRPRTLAQELTPEWLTDLAPVPSAADQDSRAPKRGSATPAASSRRSTPDASHSSQEKE